MSKIVDSVGPLRIYFCEHFFLLLNAVRFLREQLTFFTGFNPFGVFATDIASEQAGGEGPRAVGICEGSVEGVRVPDGDRHLCAGRGAGMVPVRLRVPDEAAIQPGIQPRPSNLSHPGWREEAELR